MGTWWLCECGHLNTMFAGACYGGCGKERTEAETGIVRDSLVVDRPFPDETFSETGKDDA